MGSDIDEWQWLVQPHGIFSRCGVSPVVCGNLRVDAHLPVFCFQRGVVRVLIAVDIIFAPDVVAAVTLFGGYTQTADAVG